MNKEFQALLDAAKAAERYITHIGLNKTECGEKHPQEQLLQSLRIAIVNAKTYLRKGENQ